MDLGILNKTALVFGGGSGLGQAIAIQLAAEGANVIVAGRTYESLQSTTKVICAASNTALSMVWDLSDLSVVKPNLNEIKERMGSVDILINNTGGPPPTLAEGQSPEVWMQNFNSMVLSVINITDNVLPDMREKGWGRIVTSTSAGVVEPIPRLAISNTLRSSLVGWSKTLSSEIASDGITSNIVLPGRIATDRIGFLDQNRAEKEGKDIDEVAAESIAKIPMGRYGSPEEYANVVAFMASQRASYMTGSVVRVDGGLINSA